MVLATQPANLLAYWPLGETSGVTAEDVSGNNRDGTYSGGVTLNQDGIGDGSPSVNFDGTGQVGVYSVSLRDAFDGTLGSVLGWLKLADATWTDGTQRFALRFNTNSASTSNVQVYRGAGDNQLTAVYTAGTTTKSRVWNPTTAFTGFNVLNYAGVWLPVGVTWNAAADRACVYVLGASVNELTYGAELSGLGVWAGDLRAPGVALIGQYWVGNIAHVAVWNTELSAAQMLALSAPDVDQTRPVVTLLGDSITGNWGKYFGVQFRSGLNALHNRAIGGSTIADKPAGADEEKDMTSQTVAATNDDADFIIVALGTNDGVDVAGMTATYAANLTTLLSNHPDAVIYCQQVLRKNGGSMYDSAPAQAVRAAVVQAGNPRVFTTDCDDWVDGVQDNTDPYTDGDLWDTVHMNPVGAGKVATQLVAALAAAPTFPPAGVLSEAAAQRGVLVERTACGRVV